MEKLRVLTNCLSVHGIRSFQFSETKKQFGFWAFVSLVSFSLLSYNIGSVIARYLQDPVAVTVTTLSQAQEFPSVTVCNNNPYKKSVLDQWTTLQNLDSVYQQLRNSAATRTKRSVKLAQVENTDISEEPMQQVVNFGSSLTQRQIFPVPPSEVNSGRVKRAAGDCALNPYPISQSPFPPILSFDSANAVLINITCPVSCGMMCVLFNAFILVTCPPVGTNWDSPYTTCAILNEYPNFGWLELSDIDTNATVIFTSPSASASACRSQCLTIQGCYGFTFKNGICYFNNDTGAGLLTLGYPFMYSSCGTFLSPGTIYSTIYGCDLWLIYPLSNGRVWNYANFLTCAENIYFGGSVIPFTQVNFTCNVGYNLIGANFSICMEPTYAWSNPQPTCIPIPLTTTTITTTTTLSAGVLVTGSRLWTDYQGVNEADEENCTNACRIDPACFASSFYPSGVPWNCFLFNNTYLVTCDMNWRAWYKDPATVVPCSSTTSVTTTTTTSTTTTSTTATTTTTTTPTTTTTTTTLIDLPFYITYYNQSQYKDFLQHESVNDYLSLSSAVADFLPYLLWNLSDSQLARLSYSRPEMFISCVYNSKKCIDDELLLVVDRSLGNCYTFNHKLMNDYTAFRAGRIAAEYEDWTTVAGLKVIIHEPKDSIFPDTYGYGVSPGYDTAFSFRKETSSKVNRKPEPCAANSDGSAYFYYQTNYNVEGCFRSFIQSKVVANCGCAFYKYPTPTNTNVTYCGMEKKSCVDSYLKSAEGISLSTAAVSFCKQECSFSQFRPSISMVNLIQMNVTNCNNCPSTYKKYFTSVS